jgi:hypothetical protein
MFGQYFYHETIRRSVGAFGSMFNDIKVLRKEASGNVNSQIRVPLAYGPKRKFLTEIRNRDANADYDDHKIAMTLPRMSFEMTAIGYDQSRQLSKVNSTIVKGETKSTRGRLYTKTPYVVGFSLSIYAKTHSDAHQIVEQIFPYFTPQYTLRMKTLDDFTDIVDDIPLSLTNVTASDDYEGDMAKRRIIIYTLDFVMNICFYGPIVDSKIIETAEIKTFMQNVDSDELISTIKLTTDPTPVGPDSDYSYVETITYTNDSG